MDLNGKMSMGIEGSDVIRNITKQADDEVWPTENQHVLEQACNKVKAGESLMKFKILNIATFEVLVGIGRIVGKNRLREALHRWIMVSCKC